MSFEVFGVTIPMVVAIGVLPYPVTFICTDLISELYGEKKARDMVWMGVLLNAWVIFLLWLGGVLPGFDLDANGQPLVDVAGREPTFFRYATWPSALLRLPWWPTLRPSSVTCGCFTFGSALLTAGICGFVIMPLPWSAKLLTQRQ